MIKRKIYRSFYDNKREEQLIQQMMDVKKHLTELQRDGYIMTASVFKWDCNVFLYYESIERDVDPVDVVGSLDNILIPFPDGKYWVQMMDIFHYNQPSTIKHWQRKSENVESYARINRLKPEKFSSYIFYHYQLQEEYPGLHDKYGIIGIHENLMFFYQETPHIIEDAVIPGKLDTRNSPRVGWEELMESHFEPWENRSEQWLTIEKLCQV